MTAIGPRIARALLGQARGTRRKASGMPSRLAVFALALAAALAPPASAQGPAAPTLDAVLTQMDKAAADFQSAQADFVWKQYTRVVDETDTQEGTTCFRRSRSATELYTEVTKPARKYVLYAGNKVQVYEPGIDQLTSYDVGQKRDAVESFLVLGFGGRGHDLDKSYAVKLEGAETLNGIRTARLELIPKSEKARGMFNRILLWIDLSKGVSVQQQFFEPSGDYRLVLYSNIRLNQALPPDAFKLKTTGKTRKINPQG